MSEVLFGYALAVLPPYRLFMAGVISFSQAHFQKANKCAILHVLKKHSPATRFQKAPYFGKAHFQADMMEYPIAMDDIITLGLK
jgi:hypothetical protein